MAKFTFTHSDDDGEGIATVFSQEITGDWLTHSAVAESFTTFLRGCGYIFHRDLTLRLVDDSTGEVRPH